MYKHDEYNVEERKKNLFSLSLSLFRSLQLFPSAVNLDTLTRPSAQLSSCNASWPSLETMKRDGSREHLLFRRIKWTKNKRGGNKNKTGIPRVSALDSAVWIRARPGRRWSVKSTLLAVIYNLCCDSSSFLKNRVCVSICVCVFVWRQMTFRIVESCHCCDDDDLWADFVFLLLLSSFLSLVSFFFFYVTILRLRHLKGRVKKQKRKWRRNDVCRRCDHHLFCLLCDLGQTTCRCITQSASHGRLIAGKRRHRNGCERLWTPNRRNPNAANSQRSSSRIDWWENNDGKWPLFGHTVPSLPSVTIADGNTAAPFYYRITKNNKFEPWKKQE